MEGNLGKSIDANPQSVSERLGNNEWEFSWHDVDFIVSNGIALRHISNEEAARDNADHGFTGDALALFNIGDDFLSENKNRLIRENVDIKRVSDISETYGMGLEFGLIKDYLGDGDKEVIVSLMRKKVSDFVRDSLNIGLAGLISRDAGVDGIKGVLETKSSFLLVKLGKHDQYAYDQDRYYGLGKVGKQRFEIDNIVGGVYASEVVRCLPISIFDGGRVDDSFFNEVERVYYRNIVQSVKKIAKNERD